MASLSGKQSLVWYASTFDGHKKPKQSIDGLFRSVNVPGSHVFEPKLFKSNQKYDNLLSPKDGHPCIYILMNWPERILSWPEEDWRRYT